MLKKTIMYKIHIESLYEMMYRKNITTIVELSEAMHKVLPKTKASTFKIYIYSGDRKKYLSEKEIQNYIVVSMMVAKVLCDTLDCDIDDLGGMRI